MMVGGTSIEARSAELARERLSAITKLHFPEYTLTPAPAPAPAAVPAAVPALPRWLSACLQCVTPAPPAKPDRLPETPTCAKYIEAEALYSPDSIEAELWPTTSQFRSLEPTLMRSTVPSESVHDRLHGMHAKKLHELDAKRRDHLDSLTSHDSRLALRARADVDRPFCAPRAFSSSSSGSLIGTASGRATPGASFGRAPRSSLLCEANAVITNGLAALATPPARRSGVGGGGGGGSASHPADSPAPAGYVRGRDGWVHEHDVHRVLPGVLYGQDGEVPLGPGAMPLSPPSLGASVTLSSAAPTSPACARASHEHYAVPTSAAIARYAGEPLPGPSTYGKPTSSFNVQPAATRTGTFSKDGRWKAAPPEHTIGPSPVHYSPRDSFCSPRARTSSP